MSEYQYYEWQTIDRPLTVAEQAEVDALSSHIGVTATRVWVEYHSAGFRHDPIQVLARYFDAFMYYASWGSQRLAFRFPARLLHEADLQPYLQESCVALRRVDDSLVLDMNFPAPEDGGAFEQVGDLAALLQLREDILQGDYRCLYLAWLLSAERCEEPQAEREPPVPAGLREPSVALAEFSDFFGLDAALVRTAAEISPDLHPAVSIPLEQAIARLPAAERDAFLLRLAQGESHLTLILNRRLQELIGTPKQLAAAPSRTWGELRKRTDLEAKRERR